MSAIMTEVETKIETMPIAYWSDGLWEKDIEGAELVDKYDVLGLAAHKVAQLPIGLADDEITAAIAMLVIGDNEVRADD